MSVNLADARAQFTFYDLAVDPDFSTDNTAEVGNGAFAAIVGDTFEAGDLVALVDALTFGGGVDGVELISIDDDSVSLGLTNTLGVTDIVAIDNTDAPLIVARPFVNTGNSRSDLSFTDLDADGFIRLGSTALVGNGEFESIVGRFFSRDDLPALLSELLLGDGLNGVEINTLDDDTLTLELANNSGVVDTVILDNVGAIAELAADSIDLANDQRNFGLFDASATEAFEVGDTSAVGNGEFGAIIGVELTTSDLEVLFTAVLAGDGIDGVELITVDDDTVTIALTNGTNGVVDTLIIDNAADTIQAVSDAEDEGGVDVANEIPEFGFFDVNGQAAFEIGDTSAVGNGDFAAIVGDTFEAGDLVALLDELTFGGGVDGVEIISVDNDSVTLALAKGVDGATSVTEIVTEPNDTLATATDTGLSTRFDAIYTGIGRIGDNGPLDVDLFEFSLMDGDTVRLETFPRAAPEMDTVLRLFDANGFNLATNDDSGIGLYSRINFTAPTEGIYYVGVSGFSNFSYDPMTANSGTSQSQGNYQLEIDIDRLVEGSVRDIIVIDNTDAPEIVARNFVNVANRRPEFSLTDLDTPTLISVGNTSAVGDGSFAEIVGTRFTTDDLSGLLEGLLLGDGVDGVAINTLDDDSLTLELTNASGITDLVAIDNVDAILEVAADRVDVGNDEREFAFFDVEMTEFFDIGDTSAVGNGEFADLVGFEFTRSDLEGLFAEVLAGDGVDGLTLITVDDDSFTAGVTNALTGVTDTIILDNAGEFISGRPPQPSQQLFSFETGDFAGWETLGATFVQSGGVGATDGIFFAQLINVGASDTQIESFLGVAPGSIDAITDGNATNGAAIKLDDIFLEAGQTITFDWQFATNEISTTFQDVSFFTSLDGTVTRLADVNDVNSLPGTTGWQTTTVTVAAAGVYDVGFGVANEGDTFVDSILYIDNVLIG